VSDSPAAPLSAVAFPGFAAPGEVSARGLAARPLPPAMERAVASGEVRLYQGKVRDSFFLNRGILMVTSDRVSAFDRILDIIPGKGEILNRISGYWFDSTADIIDNHIIESPGGRTLLVKPADVLPVEVVVRGYLTGSAWRDYRAGRKVSGIGLPVGMKENQKFDEPLITPSTKAEVGTHDEPIGADEIVSRGLVAGDLWARVEDAARQLFARGTELAARQGLLLVDTKYEFGLHEGELILIDEIHTPDSSRYWYADGYPADFETGRSPAGLDKEYLRRWLMSQGFMGEGDPPVIPDDVKAELAGKYVRAYELITGESFSTKYPDIEAELKVIASYF
jgi:phosphoribosylaminoimidazole-succinocarboxamide synthase